MSRGTPHTTRNDPFLPNPSLFRSDAPRHRQSRRRNAPAGGAFGHQGLTAEHVCPEKCEMPDAERITTIHGRTPESAAMVANRKRAMAITARMNRLTFNDEIGRAHV